MSPKRIERNAEVALIAIYRAWAREGEFPLSPRELGDRIGCKAGPLPDAAVVAFMLDKGWLTGTTEHFALSPIGRRQAERVMAVKSASHP